MKCTAQIALAALLAFAAACHKDNKVAQLNALNEAYKSGVFTKEEYAAKWQALTGAPPGAPAAPAPSVEPAPAVNAPAAQPPAVAPPAVAAVPQPVVVAPPPVAVSSPPVNTAATPTPVRQSVPPPTQVRQATPPQPAPAQTIPPQSSAPPAPVNPPTRQAAPPTPAPAPAAEPAEPEPAPLAGCQDAESRAGGPNAVQERFFPASEDSVRQAALQAFANLDFTVHRSIDHEIEASKKRHLSALVGAGGERVILHFSNVRKNGQGGTKVTAETKKSFTGKLAQKSWTGAVLAQMSCNMRGR